MRPDMGMVRETSGLLRAVLPWVRRLLDFRKRLEEKIDIDVASDSDAVRVDLGNTPHAIHVRLKISNFSPAFSVKLERVTASIMMSTEPSSRVNLSSYLIDYAMGNSRMFVASSN